MFPARLPPVTLALITINVIVFLAQQIIPEGVMLGYLALWDLHTPLFKPYQFFTYMFLHGGMGHIFFNLLALASFAPALESYWGGKRFLFFYIAAGIGAGFLYGAINYYYLPDSGVMLGASGALYGILMAYGMIFPEVEMMLLFPPIPIKAKYMVFLMGGMTYFLDRTGHVAHLAHFGGAATGFLIIQFWRRY
ncbi:MAG: rhomboid family intramembrane serine protease [Candidatus Nephrothrix sp. EaCA]|nr:MAG: rhomboid family intramembrane serine protease [Candidatus Nephrothrix sp. EaCA]